MEGIKSDWFTQHTDEDLLEMARVSTANFTEVLFADDTICVTSTPSAMNHLLDKLKLLVNNMVYILTRENVT
eukprot:10202153-Karenia_brevis.AAC.1